MKNLSWTFFGNLIFAFSQWFVVFLITKFANISFLGKFTSVQAITAPVFMCLTFGFRTVIASDVVSSNKETTYFSFRLITSVLAIIICMGVVLVKDAHEKDVLFLMVFYSIAKFIESLSDLIYGYYQRDKTFKNYGISFILRGVFNCVFSFIAIVYINESWFVLSFLLSWLLVFYFFDYRHYKQIFKFSIQKGPLKKLFLLTLPLAINLLLISVSTNVQRYLVEYFLGYHALGLMSGIMYFNVVGVLFVSSLSQTIIADLSSAYQVNDEKKFWRNYKKVLLPVLVIAIAYILFTVFAGKSLLGLFYNKEFAQSSGLFILAALIGLPTYLSSSIGYALTAIGKYRIQIWGTVISISMTIIGSFLLIPRYNLNGAMYAGLAASIFQCIILAIVLIKEVRKNAKAHMNEKENSQLIEGAVKLG